MLKMFLLVLMLHSVAFFLVDVQSRPMKQSQMNEKRRGVSKMLVFATLLKKGFLCEMFIRRRTAVNDTSYSIGIQSVSIHHPSVSAL